MSSYLKRIIRVLQDDEIQTQAAEIAQLKEQLQDQEEVQYYVLYSELNERTLYLSTCTKLVLISFKYISDCAMISNDRHFGWRIFLIWKERKKALNAAIVATFSHLSFQDFTTNHAAHLLATLFQYKMNYCSWSTDRHDEANSTKIIPAKVAHSRTLIENVSYN